MKRDMELIRKILLLLESHDDDPWTLQDDYNPEGTTEKSRQKFSYHVMLLHQAGFIHAIDYGDKDGSDWRPIHLTWTGHEFLDTVRDSTVWENTKEISKQAGTQAVSVMWDIAKDLIKQNVERLFQNPPPL